MNDKNYYYTASLKASVPLTQSHTHMHACTHTDTPCYFPIAQQLGYPQLKQVIVQGQADPAGHANDGLITISLAAIEEQTLRGLFYKGYTIIDKPHHALPRARSVVTCGKSNIGRNSVDGRHSFKQVQKQPSPLHSFEWDLKATHTHTYTHRHIYTHTHTHTHTTTTKQKHTTTTKQNKG